MNMVKPAHKRIVMPITEMIALHWQFVIGLNLAQISATSPTVINRCIMSEVHLWVSTKTPRGCTLDNIRNSSTKKQTAIGKIISLRKYWYASIFNMQVNKDFPQLTQRMPNKRLYVRRRHASGVSFCLTAMHDNSRRRPAGVPSNLKENTEIIFLFIENSTNIITVKIVLEISIFTRAVGTRLRGLPCSNGWWKVKEDTNAQRQSFIVILKEQSQLSNPSN